MMPTAMLRAPLRVCRATRRGARELPRTRTAVSASQNAAAAAIVSTPPPTPPKVETAIAPPAPAAPPAGAALTPKATFAALVNASKAKVC